MTKLLVSLMVLLSTQISFASGESYVACKDKGANEYNVLLVIENGKAVAYSTQQEELQVLQSINSKAEFVSIVYATDYDTNLGYDIDLTSDFSKSISLGTWESGNDSDNSVGHSTKVATSCFQLSALPTSAAFQAEQVIQEIPVN